MVINILIADDHGVLRAGLRALLNPRPDIKVVGEAADGFEAQRLAAELKPDLILMDISMPGCNGIEATRRVKESSPEIKILILSVHKDEELMREAMRAGASGYVLKHAAEEDLIHAIQAVARGEQYIHPSLNGSLAQNQLHTASDRGNLEKLTPSEKDILHLLIRGYTNHQIAEKLQLNQRVVETYRDTLMSKLGLHSRVELIEFAEKNGLMDRNL